MFMSEEERRQALAEFLRTRRARLSPADVGLPGNRRRRTPGLRREEVALLANIGTSWYVALEQGRDVHPSEQVLESIAQALQLTATEQQHFFVLAGQSPLAGWSLSEEEQVSPALQQAVKALDPHPAFVMGRRWGILAWNRAAATVLTYGKASAAHPQNLLWSHFTDPLARKVYPDWEKSARLMVALLRTDSARFPEDPWYGEMIEKLQKESAFFRLWWSRYDVPGDLNGRKEMNHPTLGHLEFDTVTLLAPSHPDLKIILYISSPSTHSKIVYHLASPASEDHPEYDSDWISRRIREPYLQLIDSILQAEAMRMWERQRDLLPSHLQADAPDWSSSPEALRSSRLGQALLIIAECAQGGFVEAETVHRAIQQVTRSLYGDPQSDDCTFPKDFHRTPSGQLVNQAYTHLYPLHELLTAKQAYQLAGVARQTLYERKDRGKLTAIYWHDELRFVRSEIEAWKEKRAEQSTCVS
jgi:transcriptional regulator with XRE-family HTH domain/predicted DNA-binding transcriptional regulator AlpA